MNSEGVGAGVGLGVGLGDGDGDGLGLGDGEGEGDGLGLGEGVGLGEGDGDGVGEGLGVGLGEGDAVGLGRGLGVGVGLGLGVDAMRTPMAMRSTTRRSARPPTTHWIRVMRRGVCRVSRQCAGGAMSNRSTNCQPSAPSVGKRGSWTSTRRYVPRRGTSAPMTV